MSTTQKPMNEYILLFRIGAAEQREAMGTPEKAQQRMQSWLAWMRDLEAKGNLKNAGQPLDQAGKVVRGRARTVTDGPFVEVKDLVAGFTIIQAHDLNHAVELSRGCPILEGDGSVEVRPVLQTM
jgi:hypothetical protein